MTLALICAGWIAWAPAADPAPPPDLARSYQEARAQAGRSPEAQVRLALWCEAHGLTAERLHHLTLAVLADPKNAAARGLMGLVSHEGRWRRPEAVADKAKADATLAEYEAKRLKAAYTADAQWALGTWCDEHGLKEQAKAHLTAVIRLDPSRENAWRKLGYKRHEGRWVTEAQLALEKADAEAQKAADRKWKPLLERSKAMLDQPSKREEAEAALANVTDPRAVPMIGRVFATAEATQPRAVQLLGQVDSPGASKALAYLAVFARSAEARRAAAETLRGRDAREYADLLIALIRDPIKYEVRPVGGPGSPGVLFVEGKKANLKRLYESASAFQPGDSVGFDRFGQPVLRRTLFADGHSNQPNVPLNPGTRFYGGYQSYSDFYSSPAPMTSGNMNSLSSINLSTPEGMDAAFGTHLLTNPSSGAFGQAITPDAVRQFLGGHPASEPAKHHASATNSSVTGPPFLISGSAFQRPTDYYTSTTAEVPLTQAVSESERSALAARNKLKADVDAIEEVNRPVRDLNDRVASILNGATRQNLPADRKTWDKWWVDQLGYALVTGQTATNPTFVEVVSSYQPQITPSNVITQTSAMNRISCFGAGTPVRTVDGVRPIESLKVGDLVLTQSTDGGALGYKPILVVHHNPPSATFRIKVGGESIISSHFHRFWVAGRGWVMARELKAGDPVRTLGGVSPVESVEADKVQLVYNLDVAEDADFFAGNVGALVHDNTLPDPRLTPFDAPPGSAGVAMAGRAE